MRYRLEWIIVIVLVALMGAGWTYLSKEDGPATIPVPLAQAPFVGNLAPDFTLDTIDGETVSLASFTEGEGKPVVLNFWATWCPPCRKEMPDLDAIGREFASRGLVILAISDEPEQTVRTFLAEHPVQYPILLDPGRAVSDALRIDSIPKTFIYDRSGRLVAQSIDMRTRGQFLALLAKAGLS